jgi:hypothetical protein
VALRPRVAPGLPFRSSSSSKLACCAADSVIDPLSDRRDMGIVPLDNEGPGPDHRGSMTERTRLHTTGTNLQMPPAIPLSRRVIQESPAPSRNANCACPGAGRIGRMRARSIPRAPIAHSRWTAASRPK